MAQPLTWPEDDPMVGDILNEYPAAMIPIPAHVDQYIDNLGPTLVPQEGDRRALMRVSSHFEGHAEETARYAVENLGATANDKKAEKELLKLIQMWGGLPWPDENKPAQPVSKTLTHELIKISTHWKDVVGRPLQALWEAPDGKLFKVKGKFGEALTGDKVKAAWKEVREMRADDDQQVAGDDLEPLPEASRGSAAPEHIPDDMELGELGDDPQDHLAAAAAVDQSFPDIFGDDGLPPPPSPQPDLPDAPPPPMGAGLSDPFVSPVPARPSAAPAAVAAAAVVNKDDIDELSLDGTPRPPRARGSAAAAASSVRGRGRGRGAAARRPRRAREALMPLPQLETTAELVVHARRRVAPAVGAALRERGGISLLSRARRQEVEDETVAAMVAAIRRLRRVQLDEEDDDDDDDDDDSDDE